MPDAAPPIDRNRTFRYLVREAAALRAAAARRGEELLALMEAEAGRRLSPAEAARVRRLRLEAEGHRHELARLQAAFARLRYAR